VNQRARTIWFWVALVAAVVLVAVVAGPPGNPGPAFDPRSTSGNGTKAMVLLLSELGAQVTLTADLPGPNVDTTLVLTDQLSADRRSGLERWMSGGGTLIVADPTSDLQHSAPVRIGHGFATRNNVNGPCPAAGLDDVNRLSTGGAFFLRLPPGAEGCFAAGAAYLLVTERVGAGRFIGLGGAGPLTNSLLGKNDNALLAADLLLPHRGANVAVMLRSPVGGGRRTLWQLLNRPTKLVLAQLLVAVIAVALWRSRRLGRPVSEEQPVQLAGSELTVAVGNLLARAGRRDAAAAGLRADLRRWLGDRLGLGSTAAAAHLAAATATRTGVTTERVLALIVDQPVADDAALVELAQQIEHVRQEVVHGHL
jgi:hypothetical protein